MSKYTPKTKDELIELVNDESIHLGDIDTRNITDMSGLFVKRDDNDDIIENPRTDFSGIEKWDVSNVKNMRGMFAYCENFNQNLNSWDTSNVEDMSYMFVNCPNFNQNLNSWNTSNVKNMNYIFSNCPNFNQNLSSWDVSNVKHMGSMFSGCENFNQNLSSWDVSNAEDMGSMFSGCIKFNQPLNSWDVSKVTNMSGMFAHCKNFNQNLNSWNTRNVYNMSGMFAHCKNFNQNLSTWNTRNVEDMYNMFDDCKITKEQAFNNTNKKNQIMTTYAEKLNFCENYVKNNEKGQELAKELARDYELNDPKTGQYSLANWLSEYERNKYIDLEANPIKIDYIGLGEQEAKNIVKSYVMDKEYNINNIDKDIEKNIQEIQKNKKILHFKTIKTLRKKLII